MRSCGSRPRRAIIGLAFAVFALAPVRVHAQASNAAKLLREAQARESVLRKEIDSRKAGAPAIPLLDRARVLVHAYDDIARLFPASPYSDDSLWHGGMLAADAFWEFGQPEDRSAAIRLLKLLTTRYATSSLVKNAGPQLDRLVAAKVAASAEPSAAAVTLKAIRQEALPGAVRVTLELDGEATFRDEQSDAPPRVTIDLQDTRPVEALGNLAQAFPGDVVRQVRVARQGATTTRVVLNLTSATPRAVYALYNPYRVIVDFSRDTSTRAAASSRATTAPPAATPPPAVPPAASSAMSRTPPPAPADDARPVSTAPARPNGAGGFSLSRQLGLGVARIVIDPGHGGHDPGAMNMGVSEADVALDIAQRLEKLLVKQPGVEVVMTRRSNTFVPLEERTAMANREGADLFLSIHVNASEDDRARGIETYFLNFAPNPAAEAIAARENAASAKTMRQLPDIVKAIALNNKIDESRDFASLVQSSMMDSLRRSNRSVKDLGVKQAPFVVLIGATMPSVLVEISFLTNPQEATLLRGVTYRQQIADALFNGVMRYQRSLKATAETVASQ